MGRTRKDAEVAEVEVVVDDSLPVVEAKDPGLQEKETAKQPDINDPEDGNKTYAEINS